jgi:hypothetical protein
MGLAKPEDIKFFELGKCVYSTIKDANQHLEGHILQNFIFKCQDMCDCTIDYGNHIVQRGM